MDLGRWKRFTRKHKDLKLPNGDKLPLQGAMFMGEKGKITSPHFMELKIDCE